MGASPELPTGALALGAAEFCLRHQGEVTLWELPRLQNGELLQQRQVSPK